MSFQHRIWRIGIGYAWLFAKHHPHRLGCGNSARRSRPRGAEFGQLDIFPRLVQGEGKEDEEDELKHGLEFSVDGRTFASQRISFAGGYRPKDTEGILARYPIGKEVPVSYAPENPAEATLETGATKQVRSQLNILLILFAAVVVLNVITYYVKSLDQNKRPAIRSYGAAGLPVAPV